MMKYLLLIPALLLTAAVVFSQSSNKVRYKDLVFPSVIRNANISYLSSPKNGTKKKYYLLDLYSPAKDTVRLRPLIVWVHGGGFKYGNKRSAGTPVWSRTFARRGYVCAAINYRLSKKKPLLRFPHLLEGCSDAIDDLTDAVAFLKKNARLYGIDTHRIILGGNSAGGIVALQSVYSSERDLYCLINKDSMPAGSTRYNPVKAIAIVNFWGAVFDTASFNNGSVPIVSVHGTKDKIVPFETGKAPMYGSLCIQRQANAMGIDNLLKPYAGYGHELYRHFNPLWHTRKIKRRWLESGQEVANFLYKHVQND
ncbi:MAG: alpha/beta hydrolase [Chitinophagaceae bacterium]|nr:alpha/beta hydrolase [Chitinophagaceae bacterium]